jgi:hypothetical protein
MQLPRREMILAGKLITRSKFSPIRGFSQERNIMFLSDLEIFKSDGEWIMNFHFRIDPDDKIE